jgi:hypothetical protein
MSRALPTYVVVNEPSGPRPHKITVRPVTTGGENASEFRTFNLIAATIRQAVYRAVLQYRPDWSRYTATRSIYGALIATNVISGSATAAEGMLRLPGVNTRALSGIFERIQESNTVIGITDIEWAFVIDPNSFNVGGSSNAVPPKWVGKKTPNVSWKSYSDKQGPISCAAVAICVCLYNRKRFRSAALCKNILSFSNNEKCWNRFNGLFLSLLC